MKNMRRLAAVIAVLFLSLSCGGKTGSTPVVVFMLGEVQVKKTGGNFMPAKVGLFIHDGDVIRTGPDSHVSIQIGDRGIVQILQESTVEAVSIFNSADCELKLSGGTVVSRLDRLGRSGSYTVKTPTVVASVRGTIFSVTYGGVISTVGVSRGKVKVTDITGGKEADVLQGKAADVNGDIVIRDLNVVESLVLKKGDVVNYINDSGTMSPGTLEEKGNSFRPLIEKIDREIEENSRMSLDEIKTRYGRIDIVTLYSGKVYSGIILSRGEIFRIRTPHGIVEVAAKSVRNTEARD